MTEPLHLSEVADEYNLNLSLRRQRLSEIIANDLLKLFKISVRSTVFLVCSLAALDYFFIAKGWVSPSDRLISEKVLLAVIGASVVQLGAGVAAIIYSLFRSPQPNGDP